MKLVELKVDEYLNLLGSDAPAPGGGSVSALAGAQGIALMNMVCSLTIGKAKYAEFEADCMAAKEKGKDLLAALTRAIDEDTEAFNMVSAAFRLAKETEEDKQIRSKAIGDATLVATEVPFKTMILSLEGLETIVGLVGRSNSNAASDLGVGALNLMAALKGAWYNVQINLSGVKDLTKKAMFEEEGKKMFDKAAALANKIETEIMGSL